MASPPDDNDNIYHCTLSKELKEQAERELNERDEYRTKDIQALRERVLANKGKHMSLPPIWS